MNEYTRSSPTLLDEDRFQLLLKCQEELKREYEKTSSAERLEYLRREIAIFDRMMPIFERMRKFIAAIDEAQRTRN